MRNTDILIVDDEAGIRDLLSEILQDEGYTVATAENAQAARKIRENTRPAMVLLDIWMPDCDGITLLREWAKNDLLDMPVVMMSGHGSIGTAIEATKIGALDYLEKPITMHKLLETVRYAMQNSKLQAFNALSLNQLGKNEKIKELIHTLNKINQTKNNILLVGEVGSPFEIVARSCGHDNRPWITLNELDNWCEYKSNWLDRARDGVVYLGDIAQYDCKTQQQLLSMMKQRNQLHIKFIGYLSRPFKSIYFDSEFNVQFIEELSNSVVTIPPLRDHLSDLVFLVNNILMQLIKSKQVRMVRFNFDALDVLGQYDWPGNVDQLRYAVKNLALNVHDGIVNAEQVVALIDQWNTKHQANFNGLNFNQEMREFRDEVEKRYFEYHMRQEKNNISRIAKKVGLERTHLYRKLKQLGMKFSKTK